MDKNYNYTVSQIIGYIKGKSAIAVARQFGGKTRNFNGERLWAHGYVLSIVGFEERKIAAYIKNQQKKDQENSLNEDGNF